MRNTATGSLSSLLFVLLVLISGPALAQIQFQDSFTDGDFTANPVWTGDAALFTVNSQNQLRTNGPATTDTAALVTAGSIVGGNTTEWRFYVKMAFSPSNNNYLKVYLASNQSNIEGPLQGYFLRIGENGSNDNLKLYKQDGSTETLLIDGSSLGLVATGFDLFIKITRSASGQWEIAQKADASLPYTSEGIVTDNSFTSSSFFGIFCRYTSSNATNFYFDDFYMGTPQVDTTGPEALTVSVTAADTLLLTFDEAVTTASTQTVANYTINNGIGNPTSILPTANALAFKLVINPLTAGQNYELIVDDLTDLAGNPMADADTLTFSYNPPFTAAYRDVVINELMADPSPQVGLPDAEFVELFNTTLSNINLAGFTFSDGGTPVVLPAHTLLPGGFVILCKAADTAAFSSFGPVLPVSLPALNNGGDDLKLRNASGTLIDEVPYTTAWYNDPVKADGGWTLEQQNPFLTCSGKSNWSASQAALGGTPGVQNSIFNNIPDTPAAGSYFCQSDKWRHARSYF